MDIIKILTFDDNAEIFPNKKSEKPAFVETP